MTHHWERRSTHPTSEYNDRNRRQAPDMSVNKRFESCYPTAHARKGPHPSHLRLVFHIDKIRRFQWKFGSERPRGSEVSVTKRASSGDQSLQQCPTLQQQKPSEFRESPWINLEQNWKLIASKCRRRQTNWKPTWKKFSEKIRLLRESPGTKTRSRYVNICCFKSTYAAEFWPELFFFSAWKWHRPRIRQPRILSDGLGWTNSWKGTIYFHCDENIFQYAYFNRRI